MSLIRSIARPLLAAPFILEGVRTAMQPERELDVAPAAFAQVDKTLEKSAVPSAIDSRTLVRSAGVVAAGAGLLYATNRAPRLAAGLLLVTTSVGIANRKRVWELRGEERMQEIQAIVTDAGLLGGILLAVVDTDGSPSVGYRVNKLVERGQKNAAKKQRELERTAKRADLSTKAKKAGKKASKRAEKLQKEAGKKASSLQKQASSRAEDLSKDASSLFDQVSKAVQDQLG